MYAKIQITGDIEVITGMHIGASGAFAAIGAVDSPIIKDARTNLPMLPGSSLKGKMRTLLAKEYNETLAQTPDEDNARLTRVFGTANKDKDGVKRARLLFSDMVMSNADELRQQGLSSLTEVKFENSISRTTAVANPRQIERAIRGTKFPLDLIYDVEQEDEVAEDFEVIAEGLRLLQYDYVGGSGTRGYGKVRFDNLSLDVVIGEVPEGILSQCTEALDTVMDGGE